MQPEQVEAFEREKMTSFLEDKKPLFTDETFDEQHYERKVSIVSENPEAEYSEPPNSDEKESKHLKRLSKISKSSSLQPIEEEIFPDYSPKASLPIQIPDFSFANTKPHLVKQVLREIMDIYQLANQKTLDLQDTKYLELYSLPADNSYEDWLLN